MTSRRDFFKDIGLGLSAMVFTPSIIRPTWRDTLRVNQPFFPHWAILRPEWVAARFYSDNYWKRYELSPNSRIEAQKRYDEYVNSLTVRSNPDYVFMRQSWYEDMIEPALTPSGIHVKPFIHLPKSFTPPVMQRI